MEKEKAKEKVMRRRPTSKSSNEFSGGEISEVNITPLADVSLTLVIMMMVIAPMVFQSMIEVKASHAVATKTKARVEEKPLYVDITPKGFTLNSKAIETEYELFRLLQKSLVRKKDRTVLITSDKSVPYENVIRILDLVKQSGASNLSLVPRKSVS